MKFLFPAICWVVLIGGFACAKRPALHPFKPPAEAPSEPIQEKKAALDPNEAVLTFDEDAPTRLPIFFDFDSFVLKETGKAWALADYLLGHPKKAVILVGHCSPEGTTEYNLALGFKRAQAVRVYLESAGISDQRITCKSLGEEDLISDSPGLYPLNRRVEISLEDSK